MAYTEQYLSAKDLNALKGLMHYLDTSIEGLDIEASVTDSNGEPCGVIKRSNATGMYSLHFLVREES